MEGDPMTLRITDPDHPHYGKTAYLVPEKPEATIRIVRLADGTKTSVLAGQFRYIWRDGSE